MTILLPLFSLALGAPLAQADRTDGCGQGLLIPKTVLEAGEAQLRDSILELLIAEARIAAAQSKVDPELAKQLRWTANEGVNIQSAEDMKALSPMQLEAMRIATLLDPAPAVWANVPHFADNPLEIALNSYPELGLGRVTAHLSLNDLTLNGNVKERLLGVTFIFPLIDGDNTSVELPAIITSMPMQWGRGNDRAKITRRRSLMGRHRRRFDQETLGQPRIRVLHSVISLGREKTPAGRFIYVLPDTEQNSSLIFKASANPLAKYALAKSLEGIFATALSAAKEVKVINGYQNGDNKSPMSR